MITARFKSTAALLVLLATSLLAGCATLESEQADQQAVRQIEFQQVDQAARMMVGRYIGLSVQNTNAQPNGDQAAPQLVRLDVSVDKSSSANQAVVRLQQSSAVSADDGVREFLLSFRPANPDEASALSANRLQGAFAPLNSSGQIVRSCSLETLVQSNGFVAQTRAEDCQFSSANGQVALIKEIAHDGQRLVIGDRLLDVATGEAVAPDQVIQFDRIQSFSGWAGVRGPDDSEWRLASDFQIESTGIAYVPRDAGGMDLGIALEIAPYRWRADEPSVLRIRAFDLASNRVIGQSWANWNASQIGLALPQLQIGLSIERTRR